MMELNNMTNRTWSIFACSAKQDKGKYNIELFFLKK